MVYIDFILRIAGITLLLLIACMIIRDAWHVRAARFGVMLALSLSAVLAVSVSAASIVPPVEMRYILMPLGSSTAIFIWWYCLALFNDDFRLGPIEWSVAAIWSGLWLINITEQIHLEPLRIQWPMTARFLIATCIVIHICYVALKERSADLIESRRRARIFVSIAIATLFLIDLFGERIYGLYYTPQHINVIQVTAFVAVVIFNTFWMLRFESAELAFERRAAAEPSPTAAAPSLTAKEQQIYDRLLAVMETEKIYLEPDLSIGALAARIDAPEHQLRALINKSMGHRNFRAYLNGYRMADATQALADPAKADIPILTIAMDSGFASLASFNRAFKLSTGVTPSDYRKQPKPAKTPPQN